jgi:tetratricopeptide (TPR) repeat protein
MKILTSILKILLLACLLLPAALVATAQEVDPLDSSQIYWPDPFESNVSDEQKSEDELISDALNLQSQEKLLDYRSKLLTLVRRFPKNLTGHLLLSEYYLRSVGHFRLSMRYALKAKKIFLDTYGQPPYPNNFTGQAIHSSILSLISDIELNLDDYQASLDSLLEMEKFGYYEQQLPSSKAWVLMKLNRVEEAIATARAGVMMGAAPGHTLNVLGILLSLHDEREASIATFQQAIDYELSFGSDGNASTPLNNIGEVYRETFQEDLAINAWEQAVRLPDGCQHILPSLNLAVVHLESLNLNDANEALNNFESCFAQYTLKNDEEHKAIILLARGRIAWLSGDIDQAIEDFTTGLNRQQWFGKIGTSQEDLEAGLRVSLATALASKIQELKNTKSWSIGAYFKNLGERISLDANRRWQLRKARLLLFGRLSDFEDLYARHSDSMLDYSWLGTILRDQNSSFIERLVEKTQKGDRRTRAQNYYNLYRAENLVAHGSYEAARPLLQSVISEARKPYDQGVKANALSLLAQTYQPNEAEYQKSVLELFEINPAIIKLRGLKLPVQALGVEQAARDILTEYNFIWSASSPWGIKLESNGETQRLNFYEVSKQALIKRAESKQAQDLYKNFIEAVFTGMI